MGESHKDNHIWGSVASKRLKIPDLDKPKHIWKPH